MNDRALTAALAAALDAERGALERVIAALRAETTELSAARSDQLDELTRSKSRDLADLTTAREQRLAAMSRLRIPHDTYAATIALARDPALAKRWATLQSLANEALLQNTLNAKLAGMRLKLVSSRLEALRGAAGRNPVYAADGRAQSGPGRVIASA